MLNLLINSIGTFAVLPGILRFLLRSSLSALPFAAISVFSTIAVPLLYPPSSIIFLDSILKIFAWVIFPLRALEIATFDRVLTRQWSLRDHAEFVTTGSNAQVRLLETKKDSGVRPVVVSIPVHERTLAFHVQHALKVVLSYLCYSAARAYFDVSPYAPVVGLLDVRDGKAVVDHVMFLILLMSLFEVCNGLVLLPLAAATKSPFVPVFRAPLLATSIRDFWSRRWNMIIKGILHRLSFAVVVSMLSKSPSEKRQKPTKVQFGVASMAAFFMSGMLHEYLIYMFVPTPHIFGENTLFFMLHGVFCAGQVLSGGSSGGWVGTMGLLLLTSPLFVRAYETAGFFSRLVVFPVPEVLWVSLRSVIISIVGSRA
ncbi:hypothetical protein HDU77_000084 [Chytriomyces hyalinus]|nr:hypothetical protein HDU77_000084 [Chytriomyces hyalinus]